MFTRRLGRLFALRLALLATMAFASQSALAQNRPDSIVYQVEQAHDRLEMTVNTSRMLTLDKDIPRAQVNNSDILSLTAVGPRQVQIHAKKPGMTEVNLWDDQGQVHSIDVTVFGDVRQLTALLKQNFPTSSVRIVPGPRSILLTGFADRPDHITTMVEIAKDYFPNVINGIRVGGSQQVLLHVKVMEVDRTKARDLGFDFGNVSGAGQDFVRSSVSGLLSSLTATQVGSTGAETFAFGIVDPSNSFFGILSALQRNQLMKVLAEPTLVTVSGRPAYFQVGGEIPVMIPQSLGTVTIDWRRFGTQLDFVPVVLGNGNVRLEVRPRVTEIDTSISIELNGTTIPGFRSREVETGVELKVGQTLALAGLIQNRVESTKSGLPWISDLPYVGVPFRRIRETNTEVELLILVRPELAEALDCDQVPPCGPGEYSTSPRDFDFYVRGYQEVPKYGPMMHGGVYLEGPPVEEVPAGQPVVPPAQSPPPEAGPSASMPHRSPSAARTTQRPSSRIVAQETRPAPSRTSGAIAPTRTAPYNRSNTQQRQAPQPASGNGSQPGFIGPVGYDVIN